MAAGSSERGLSEVMIATSASHRFWDHRHQAWTVPVLVGERYVTDRDEELTTVLGSCVAICVRDRVTGVGGMNHLLLPENFIDHHRNTFPFSFEDQQNSFRGVREFRFQPKHVIQAHERQIGAAHVHQLPFADERLDHFALGLNRFEYRQQRNDVRVLADSNRHAFDDREGQRKLECKGGALAGHGFNADRAAEPLDVTFHHIHSDPAAGYVRDLFCGRESRFENEHPDLLIRQLVGFCDQSLFDAFGQNLVSIETSPIVLHGDADIAALVEGIEANDALLRFAGRDAFGRRFETMIRGVSHEVRQWITDGFNHGLVEFCFLARKD